MDVGYVFNLYCGVEKWHLAGFICQSPLNRVAQVRVLPPPQTIYTYEENFIRDVSAQ
jgi:hypothetical protein